MTFNPIKIAKAFNVFKFRMVGLGCGIKDIVRDVGNLQVEYIWGCRGNTGGIRTVILGSNFTVRIFSKSSGNLGGEVAKTLLKHLFY